MKNRPEKLQNVFPTINLLSMNVSGLDFFSIDLSILCIRFFSQTQGLYSGNECYMDYSFGRSHSRFLADSTFNIQLEPTG